MKTRIYGFTNKQNRVLVGTYETKEPHDESELRLVIGELCIGGLQSVSGFKPTKRATRLSEINEIHAQ